MLVVQVYTEVTFRGEELHDKGDVDGAITTKDCLKVECTLPTTLRERAINSRKFAESVLLDALPYVAWRKTPT